MASAEGNWLCLVSAKAVSDPTAGVAAGSSPLWQGAEVPPLLLINDRFKPPPFLFPVFAYGATGAGKTYTMLGSEKSPGIMYLTMVELYKRIESRKEEKSCKVLISYQEVSCVRAGSPPAARSLSLGSGLSRPCSATLRVPAALPAVPGVPRAALEPGWKQAHPPSSENWCCWFLASGAGHFLLLAVVLRAMRASWPKGLWRSGGAVTCQ